MRLFEYEGKKILTDYGLPVPQGEVVSSPKAAAKAAKNLGSHVVIKAQVLVSGRGRAGVIRPADSAEEAENIARELLGTSVREETIRQLLIEERLNIKQEYYLGLTIDPIKGRPVLIVSREGGIDIEEINVKSPERVGRQTINVREGLPAFKGRQLALQMGFSGKSVVKIGQMAARLYKAFRDCDAIVAEINPLVLTEEDEILAADAKFDLDDDAMYRHPQYTLDGRIEGETQLEIKARRSGVRYVELDGDIAIAGNGAGLMMTTVDLVEKLGGRAANFVDGGGAGARGGSGKIAINWWRDIINIVLGNRKVKVLLFNMLTGNNRCDEVAEGIIRGLEENRRVPVVVRLSGTRQEEGRQLLQKAGYISYDSTEEAAIATVKLAQEAEVSWLLS